MSEKGPKRHFMKVEVSLEQKLSIEAIYGPEGFVSDNIRRALLDRGSRQISLQKVELIRALNSIEAKLSELLRRSDGGSPEELINLIEACMWALVLIENLESHAP